MKLQCSYCRCIFGETEPLDDHSVSHGMCSDCFAHFDRQWSGQGLEEFLDRLPFPVLAIDGDSRVAAINEKASAMVQHTSSEVRGLLGGEATECVYSRLPEGCGRTRHCHLCAIRRCVMDTHESGEPHRRVPATLNQQAGPVQFLISTEKILPPLGGPEIVLLSIEEVPGDEETAG